MSSKSTAPSPSSLNATVLDPAAPNVAALYAYGKEHVLALVRTLRSDQLVAPVPGCPGWTVHGVVSHLAGIATDAIEGRLAGIPDDAHTGAQVAQRADNPTSVVLREWERSASQFELVLNRMPSAPLPAAIDVAVHEQDIRGAVEMPGHRDNPVIHLVVTLMINGWCASLRDANLDVPAIFTANGDLIGGDRDSTIGWTTTEFEIFRTAFGRRSAAQFAANFEGADPLPYLARLVRFQVAIHDIFEDGLGA
jgi:uncharacterized protein (TIGR03083 family)